MMPGVDVTISVHGSVEKGWPWNFSDAAKGKKHIVFRTRDAGGTGCALTIDASSGTFGILFSLGILSYPEHTSSESAEPRVRRGGPSDVALRIKDASTHCLLCTNSAILADCLAPTSELSRQLVWSRSQEALPEIAIDVSALIAWCASDDPAASLTSPRFWTETLASLIALTIGELSVCMPSGGHCRAVLIMASLLCNDGTFGKVKDRILEVFKPCDECKNLDDRQTVFSFPSQIASAFPAFRHGGKDLCCDCGRASLNSGLPGWLRAARFDRDVGAPAIGPILVGVYPGMRDIDMGQFSLHAHGFLAEYEKHVIATRAFLRSTFGRQQAASMSTGVTVGKTVRDEEPSRLQGERTSPDEEIEFVLGSRHSQTKVRITQPGGLLAFVDSDSLKKALLASGYWVDAEFNALCFAHQLDRGTQHRVSFRLADSVIECDLQLLERLDLVCLVGEALKPETGHQSSTLILQVNRLAHVPEDVFLDCVAIRLQKGRTPPILGRRLAVLIPHFKTLFGDASQLKEALLAGYVQCQICGCYGDPKVASEMFLCEGASHTFCIPCVRRHYRQTEPGRFRRRVKVFVRDRPDLLPDAVVREALPNCCGYDGTAPCRHRLPVEVFQQVWPELERLQADLQARHGYVARGRQQSYSIIECPNAECVGAGYVQDRFTPGLVAVRVQCWTCNTTFHCLTTGIRATRHLCAVLACAWLVVALIWVASDARSRIPWLGLETTWAHVFQALPEVTVQIKQACSKFLLAGVLPVATFSGVCVALAGDGFYPMFPVLGAGRKACPGCGVITEKDGGCDHMTCSTCRTHWNWSTRTRQR